MAFTQVYVNRACPDSAFEYLEEVVADTVGSVVYGERYPEEKGVDIGAPMYGRLGTFMALKVEIDTEDLPVPGWLMRSDGLCLPAGSAQSEAGNTRVLTRELTEGQRDKHFGVQGDEITAALAAHRMWEGGAIGWQENMDPELKLGVLVARVEGAWRATYPNKH